MKKTFGAFLPLFLFLVLFSVPSVSIARLNRHVDAGKLNALPSFGKLPLSFVQNRGQVNRGASFYLKGRQGTIYFTNQAIVYDLTSSVSTLAPKGPKGKRQKPEHLSFTLRPVGANKCVKLFAKNRLPGKVNYPAHRAGHLKTALTALEISLVHDGT